MTAPLQEVLDWLAEQDGWTWGSIGWVKPMLDADPGSPAFRKAGGMHECNNGHPITLDRLAGMLDGTGWRWSLIEHGESVAGSHGWTAILRRGNVGDAAGSGDLRPTELEARARVVAAVKMRSENV